MTKTAYIEIVNGALQERDEQIILRGVVSPKSLAHLQVDDYQREVAAPPRRKSIRGALKEGKTLPDIELGMRGQRFKEISPGVFHLYDPTYLIDGLQRVSTAIEIMEEGSPVELGVKIMFNTTQEIERRYFLVYNTTRSRVSSNKHLHNMKDESRPIMMLYTLSKTNKDFALCGRITWTQNKNAGELISAITLANVAIALHSHKGPRVSGGNVESVAQAFERTVEAVGLQNVKDNLKTFFGMIDECWGVRLVRHVDGAPHLRYTFLLVLAQLFSDHHDFWTGPAEAKLFIHAPMKRKIQQFPITTDPEVKRLAGASGQAREILLHLLWKHINSGRRTKHITARHGHYGQMKAEFGHMPIDEEELEEESA